MEFSESVPKFDLNAAAGGGLDAGAFLTSRGDTEGAIAMFEPNVELARATHGEEHTEFATRLSNLADAYTDAGRLDEAETGFLRVLEIGEKLLAPDDPSFAVTLNNLGRVQWKRRDFARAEPLFQRALEIGRVHYGDESPLQIQRVANLASLFDNWAEQPGEAHRRAEARRLKDEALRIARLGRGERHPEVWQYLLNHLLHLCDRSGQGGNKDRLGELLGPEITAVEAGMRDWVAEDPSSRHFGPPPFSEHGGRPD